MLLIRRSILATVLAVIVTGLAGCASSSGGAATGPGGAHPDAPFGNVLVVGVAANYEGQSLFERRLVSDLKSGGTNAIAFYVAAGGNKPIERELIEKLVQENGFDAVLVSRVLNRDAKASMKAGSTSTEAVRKDGGVVDLFRYDYEEINEPPSLDVSVSVSFTTELFAVSDSQRVWSIESRVSAQDYLEQVVNEASETIVRRLKRDRLIAN